MEPPYVGPFTIDSLNKHSYFISDATGTLYNRPVVRKELKVAKAATMEEAGSETYVEAILAHKQDKINDSFLYKVQWRVLIQNAISGLKQNTLNQH